MISSKTSFIALIGNPVSHSLSPIMQNAALQYLGLDLIYIAVPCKDEDLELVLNSFKKINCKGLNITIPHKEKVFNLCSEISPIANKLKAINTLKLNSEKMKPTTARLSCSTSCPGLIPAPDRELPLRWPVICFMNALYYCSVLLVGAGPLFGTSSQGCGAA